MVIDPDQIDNLSYVNLSPSSIHYGRTTVTTMDPTVARYAPINTPATTAPANSSSRRLLITVLVELRQ